MSRSHVTVIGAGIVGTCIARRLQRDGHDVTLVDRDAPGSGCSFGNSGAILSREAATQLPGPRLLKQLPGMLFDSDAPLVFRWPYLFRMMPWLRAFLFGCTAAQQRRTAEAMAALLDGTTAAYDALVKGSAATGLIRRNGILGLSRSDDWFEGDAWRRELNAALGAEMRELKPEELRQMEPSLSSQVRRAMYYPNAYSTPDPGALTRQLAEDVETAGGTIVKAAVRGIDFDNGRATGLQTDGNELRVDQLVIAAGAFSHGIARMMGVRVLLDTERGYHAQIEGVRTSLSRTLLHGEHAIGINPMKDGLRIAGTVEFGGLDGPPDYDRARPVLKRGRSVLRELESAEPRDVGFWMGRRPTLPDYRPVIGACPGIANCWFAFGHQHLGLTLAARTGDIVADLVGGRDPGLDLAPFRADRF